MDPNPKFKAGQKVFLKAGTGRKPWDKDGTSAEYVEGKAFVIDMPDRGSECWWYRLRRADGWHGNWIREEYLVHGVTNDGF